MVNVLVKRHFSFSYQAVFHIRKHHEKALSCYRTESSFQQNILSEKPKESEIRKQHHVTIFKEYLQ